MANPETLYLAEPIEARIVEPLDMMTLIYQRRSGITHMVGEPVPQILESMGSDAVDAATLAARLVASFDLGGQNDAVALIAERLEELAELGLVERVHHA